MSIIEQLTNEIIDVMPTRKWMVFDSETVLDTDKVYLIIMRRRYYDENYDEVEYKSLSFMYFDNFYVNGSWTCIDQKYINVDEDILLYTQIELPNGFCRGTELNIHEIGFIGKFD